MSRTYRKSPAFPDSDFAKYDKSNSYRQCDTFYAYYSDYFTKQGYVEKDGILVKPLSKREMFMKYDRQYTDWDRIHYPADKSYKRGRERILKSRNKTELAKWWKNPDYEVVPYTNTRRNWWLIL